MRKTMSILFALALVLSFSVVATTPVAAATINVPADHATIQAAVNAASPGDTIMVAAGTYPEHLVITKDDLVVKSADGREATFITGTHTTFPGLPERVLVGISGDRVTFEGFTLQGVYSTTHDYTISVYGDEVQILNNEIIGDPTSAGMDVGIQVWRDSDAANLEGNIIRTMSHSGISLGGGTLATNVRVHSNQVYDTERDYGIAVDRAPSSIVTGNHIEGAGAAGIYVVNRAGRSVAGTVIEGNTIQNNPELGIRIRDAGAPVDDVEVTGNIIVGNRKGIYAEGTDISGVTARCNSIVDNTEFGIHNISPGVFDAILNWWGHASGPYHATENSTGTGDPVSDDVNFTPWLTTPCPPTISQPAPVCIGTATGSGSACLTASHGVMSDLVAVAAPSLPSVNFPHGMFSFKITGLTPGQTVDVTITLPSAVPVGTVWWKYDNGSWSSLPNLNDNGDKIMVIRLTDGGVGDSDNIPGQITDPGGPGNPMTVGWDGSPASKAAVMIPIIGLLAAIAGAGMLVWRRRRAEG